eukprot:TRINITY_DN3548_c0_g2_i2.p1 TRINITY_DN3548_c0_g2~~TRINITY_DN3548_c0_g2_i2.p1  ORF type:complete len:399 (+),score=81.24 TRINITY_DN3548_c0_g2_i2:96-1199(+)
MSDHVRVEWDDLVTFASSCLRAAGSSSERAALAASVLVLADARGIASHGLNRLHIYCDELIVGRVDAAGGPRIVNDLGAAVLADAGNTQGIPTAAWAMNVATERAAKHGVGVVSLRNANHFGIAGYYCMEAAKKGMIGMAFTNASPVAVPFRSAQPALGTNPIACAAPTPGLPCVVDMATTRVPLGRFEAALTAGKSMPSATWGVDKEGRLSADPARVLDGGGPSFLGGDSLGGGHKGYALGVMVEMLCGVLSGASAGPEVSHAMNPAAVGKKISANLGQFFVAVDAARLSPGYAERLQRMSGQLRALPQAKGSEGPVLMPGDPEWEREDESRRIGVALHGNLWKKMNALGAKLKVPVPALKMGAKL